MKTAKLSLAGKTFLAGEYLALNGGPAVILATDPRFQMRVTERQIPSSRSHFHPDSPAGLYFEKHKDFFSNYQLDFEDPYEGKGGFGASSAQFAMLHAVKQLGHEVFGESERFIDWHEMLSDYRELLKNDVKTPSGADIVGAVSGAVTWFDREHGQVQTFAWPFQEYDFGLYHTGAKLATHEYLKTGPRFDDKNMREAVGQIHQGLKHVHFDLVLKGLKEFAVELSQQGLVAEHTLKILSGLAKNDRVLFAKGCGAQGSDVIFVLMEQGQKAPEEIMGLKKIADSKNVSPGIKVHT